MTAFKAQVRISPGPHEMDRRDDKEAPVIERVVQQLGVGVVGLRHPHAKMDGTGAFVVFEFDGPEMGGFGAAMDRALTLVENAWGSVTGLRPVIAALDIEVRSWS